MNPSPNPNASAPSLLTVSPSPHIRHHDSTRSIMGDVCIALIPALLWGCYVFGLRALILTALSVLSCVLFELLYEKLLRLPVRIGDLSSAVTGMLLAFSLPVSVPLWMPVLGAFFAIVIVKMLFGGIGKNIVNPAVAARVFLFISFPAMMAAFTAPFDRPSALAVTIPDAVTSATPLAALKSGQLPEATLFDLILGSVGGCIGEVSAVALILGFVYLLFRRVVTLHTPVACLLTVLLLTILFPQAENATLMFALTEFFSGGLLLAALFMANDYTTSPVTPLGRVIFGVGCGALTVFIRYFGGYPEGISFAVLIMNLLVFYIDSVTRPKPYGYVKKGKK